MFGRSKFKKPDLYDFNRLRGEVIVMELMLEFYYHLVKNPESISSTHIHETLKSIEVKVNDMLFVVRKGKLDTVEEYESRVRWYARQQGFLFELAMKELKRRTP